MSKLQEKSVYTGLLKGSIIGSLRYADKMAATMADLIEREGTLKIDFQLFYAQLIDQYGDMLEEEEEMELKKILYSRDIRTLVERLRQVEKAYCAYFIELIAERALNVQTVYEDVTSRTAISMEDDDIDTLYANRDLKRIDAIGSIWKKILRLERQAILELHNKTHAQLAQHVVKNNGQEDDAFDLWSETQVEFRKKLAKMPVEPGYYQWKPEASIYTYFNSMYMKRWLDVLRRRKREKIQTEGDYTKYLDTYGSTDDPDSELKDKVMHAIRQLDPLCQRFLLDKYFGDYQDLSSKEIGEITGMAAGTIDNTHSRCLSRLRSILNSQLK